MSPEPQLPWSLVPTTRVPAWVFVPVCVVLVIVDSFTGPYFQLPSAYILFVVVASWLSGLRAGLGMAIVLPFTRVALMEWVWHQPWNPSDYFSTALVRLTVWSLMAVITARLADYERDLRKQRDVLASLLPVCTFCHKIHAADDQWETLDVYAARTQGQFASGLCPDCARSQFPEHFPPTTAA